jgi:hypothetical protein
MWQHLKFYFSKIGGLGLATLVALAALLLWNRQNGDDHAILPHFTSLMNLMLILMAAIAITGAATVTAHRIVIARRMRRLNFEEK